MKKKAGFSLVQINTDQFSTIENEIDDKSAIDILANIDFGINSERKRVSCIAKFEFQYKSHPFIVLAVNCAFQLDENKWNGLINASNISFPKNLLQHLAVITIGTARGVLHAKTENTAYNMFFLPTIDITGMIKEDLTFPLG